MVVAVTIRRAVGVLLLAGAASAFIASPMQRPAPFCSKLRLGVSMSEASEETAAAADLSPEVAAELIEAAAEAAAEEAAVQNIVLLGISAGDKISVVVADDFDLINAKKAWKKRRRTKSPLLIPVQSATVGDAVTLLRMSQEAAVGLHPGQKLQAWVADIRTDENRLILSSSPRYALRRKHGNANRDRKGPTGESVHISHIKSGMPLRGRIVKVLDSGAFVNCGVQRKGRGGVRRNVDGYLSRADLAGKALLPAQVSLRHTTNHAYGSRWPMADGRWPLPPPRHHPHHRLCPYQYLRPLSPSFFATLTPTMVDNQTNTNTNTNTNTQTNTNTNLTNTNTNTDTDTAGP